MKRIFRYVWIGTMAALLALTALAGCGKEGTTAQVGTEAIGCLSLRVNPEIDIHYDENGKVTRVVGENEEGREILQGYSGYEGKDCATVVGELVERIKSAGYFVPDADGLAQDVTLQIAPGSEVPSDDFLPAIQQEVQGMLADVEISGRVVEIDVDDYDPKYQKNGQPSPYINRDKAYEIALMHSGVSAQDAKFVEKDYDLDDGTPTYEIEFYAGGYEYDYEINAEDGAVIQANREREGGTVNKTPSQSAAQSTPRPAAQGNAQSATISQDKALQAALSHSGVAAKDARVWKNELDRDDGRMIYEIEFSANGYEYEYDVDAQTGGILQAERDWDD